MIGVEALKFSLVLVMAGLLTFASLSGVAGTQPLSAAVQPCPEADSGGSATAQADLA